MRRLLLLSMIILCLTSAGISQLQRGNILVGGDLANIDLNLNKGGNFSLGIQPKAAWFVRDNKALGAYVDLNLTTVKGEGTSVGYGVGALARYYFSDKDMELTRHTRFFIEANAGIEGYNPAVGDNTNGLGIGAGPGIAYFITPNIGLEGLIKYRTIVGFGSAPSSSNLSLNFGFQVYLPRKTINKAVDDVKSAR
jgi:hypothetical protein